jgi:hypothetical protein
MVKANCLWLQVVVINNKVILNEENIAYKGLCLDDFLNILYLEGNKNLFKKNMLILLKNNK